MTAFQAQRYSRSLPPNCVVHCSVFTTRNYCNFIFLATKWNGSITTKKIWIPLMKMFAKFSHDAGSFTRFTTLLLLLLLQRRFGTWVHRAFFSIAQVVDTMSVYFTKQTFANYVSRKVCSTKFFHFIHLVSSHAEFLFSCWSILSSISYFCHDKIIHCSIIAFHGTFLWFIVSGVAICKWNRWVRKCKISSKVTGISTNFFAQSSGAHTICGGIPYTNLTFQAMVPTSWTKGTNVYMHTVCCIRMSQCVGLMSSIHWIW